MFEHIGFYFSKDTYGGNCWKSFETVDELKRYKTEYEMLYANIQQCVSTVPTPRFKIKLNVRGTFYVADMQYVNVRDTIVKTAEDAIELIKNWREYDPVETQDLS